MKSRRIFLIALILLPVLLVAGFLIWGWTPAQPMPEALAALVSDASVSVETSPWLTFTPQAGTPPTTGFIFYPGGRVDARAYAPFARAIAEDGYLAVIVPVPLNLAFFGINRADEVVRAHPEVAHWVVGGHSLGGVAAAQYAEQNTDTIEGIAFWASYPAGDMRTSPLRIVSISASNDGLSTPEKIEASRTDLPPDTRFVVIEGGNHAQFGWYGEQAGDNLATISRVEQQAQTVDATIELLHEVEQR